MNLTQIIDAGAVRVRISPPDKDAALLELARIAVACPGLAGIDEGAVYTGLREREELGSTGFGGGIAIPHCRLASLQEFVMGIGLSKRGINFEALDDRKVHLFCFMAGPEDQPNAYVKVLATISQALREESARREPIPGLRSQVRNVRDLCAFPGYRGNTRSRADGG